MSVKSSPEATSIEWALDNVKLMGRNSLEDNIPSHMLGHPLSS